jgi:hypothetical protein
MEHLPKKTAILSFVLFNLFSPLAHADEQPTSLRATRAYEKHGYALSVRALVHPKGGVNATYVFLTDYEEDLQPGYGAALNFDVRLASWIRIGPSLELISEKREGDEARTPHFNLGARLTLMLPIITGSDFLTAVTPYGHFTLGYTRAKIKDEASHGMWMALGAGLEATLFDRTGLFAELGFSGAFHSMDAGFVLAFTNFLDVSFGLRVHFG